MTWYYWLMLVGAGWLVFRLVGEWYCRLAIKKWFGKPEPGSIRLFGRGQRRPIQSIETLKIPQMTIPEVHKNKFKNDFIRRKKNTQWSALADGLVIGAGAHAAAIASSEQATSALENLPDAFEKVDIGANQSFNLNEAQQIGYESWLKGQIGEAVAADILTIQGHHIEFASTPNQPGWDLIVDGIPMNVKVGESAVANISEHFEKYPHIEVITDQETASILNHPMVHGLPGLESSSIQSILHSKGYGATSIDNTISAYPNQWEGINNTFDSADSGILPANFVEQSGVDSAGFDLFDVPWLTIGYGLHREAALSEKYGNCFEESIGAIVADIAGVGVGAKVGAAVGAVLGPIGMLGGAILGAIIGKGVVNDMRRSIVEKEFECIKPKLNELDKAWDSAAKNFASTAKRIEEKWNLQFRADTQHECLAYKEEIKNLLQEQDKATFKFFKSIFEIFEKFEEWLNEDRLIVYKRFPQRPLWMQVLIPTKSYAARVLVDQWWTNKRIELAEWRERFARIVAEEELSGTFNLTDARNLLLEFTRTYKIWDVDAASVLKATLDDFNAISRKATQSYKKTLTSLLEKLQYYERNACAEIERVWAKHERSLIALAQPIDDDVKSLARKVARAGMGELLCPPLELFSNRSKNVKLGIRQKLSGTERLSQLKVVT